jgi:predicted HTH domain antitoxin
MAGVPVSEIVADLISQGGREARLRSSAAIEAFEHAVMVYRVGLIRAMVDEEKLSFAEVARLMGVSRQMIARLYRHDECIPFA